MTRDKIKEAEYSGNDQMAFHKDEENYSWIKNCTDSENEATFVIVNENRRTI